MTSESDDDFLSADEGTDDDDLTPPTHKDAHSSPTLENKRPDTPPSRPAGATDGRTGGGTDKSDTKAEIAGMTGTGIASSDDDNVDNDDDDDDDDGGNDADIDDDDDVGDIEDEDDGDGDDKEVPQSAAARGEAHVASGTLSGIAESTQIAQAKVADEGEFSSDGELETAAKDKDRTTFETPPEVKESKRETGKMSPTKGHGDGLEEMRDVEPREESHSVSEEISVVTESSTSDGKDVDTCKDKERKSEGRAEETNKSNGERKSRRVATEDCTQALHELKISCKDEASSEGELKESVSITGDARRKDLNTDKVIEDMKTDQQYNQKGNEADKTKATSDSIPDRLGRNTTSSPAEEGKDGSTDASAKKLRESKIGKRKPREKLGERLGARKLGARVISKQLEGISSDDIAAPSPGERENEAQSQHGNWEMEVSRKGEEEWRSREERQRGEEEEERWQQAQQLSQTQASRTEEDIGGWGDGWGGWGSTLLTAASTFTREVGRGVGTVMETVESGLGVPDPETLAREVVKEEKEQLVSSSKAPSGGGSEEDTGGQHRQPDGHATTLQKPGSDTGSGSGGSGGGMWFGSLVSGVSGALESASNKVLMGGLDTLEVIGRKAMDVIQEGDPGLRRKRAFLISVKPNLSQVLQEARQRAEEEREGSGVGEGQHQESNQETFETAWDRTEGVVHLEALSLVSRQCETKMAVLINTFPHYMLDVVHGNNAKIKGTCAMEEEESLEGDLAQHIAAVITATTLPLGTTKICQAWSLLQEVWGKGGAEEEALYTSLAEMVSQLVALIHKAAELALITPQADPVKLAAHFKELSSGVCGSLESTADQVCGTIATQGQTTDSLIKNTITNIYLQVSHGNRYVQQSMGCLSAVLQHANAKRLAAQL